jgi:TPR repeat protein
MNDTDAAERALHDAQAAAAGDPVALDRLMSSAESGAIQAQFRLGMLYKEGKGVPRDPARYALWMRKAADQGLAAAQVRLIGLYEEGVGVDKDPGQAAQWAMRAAAQGEVAGQVALVTDYYYGRGVPRNYVEAIKWQTILEAAGYAAPGDEFSKILEDKAGPVQAAQGRALAREWLAAFRARK